MTRLKLMLSYLVLIAIRTERSFVSSAPTTSTPQQKGSPEVVPETLDANVKELESLKQSIGKTLEMIKSQASVYSNMNGHAVSQSEAKSEVRQDDKLLAGIGAHIDKEQPSGSLRIDVDIPEKNIHRSSVSDIRPQESAKRSYTGGQDEDVAPGAFTSSRDASTIEKPLPSQYTALDMAEYIFWTGDEKGVTAAIEEFQQTGLMTREEAIAYLEEIKYNLDYLQRHYDTQFGLNDLNGHSGDRAKTNIDNIASENLLQSVQQGPSLKTSFDITKLRFQDIDKKADTSKDDATLPVAKQQVEDYDELMDRLKVADFLYTQFTLEEVIYQLAKVMFTQGLARGGGEAQTALQKFTIFLETEAEKGHISRTLEKKVLDVLIAALTDTLSEHPEIRRIREYSLEEDRRNALRQISLFALAMLPQNQNAIGMQLKPDPLVDLAKYKTMR